MQFYIALSVPVLELPEQHMYIGSAGTATRSIAMHMHMCFSRTCLARPFVRLAGRFCSMKNTTKLVYMSLNIRSCRAAGVLYMQACGARI